MRFVSNIFGLIFTPMFCSLKLVLRVLSFTFILQDPLSAWIWLCSYSQFIIFTKTFSLQVIGLMKLWETKVSQVKSDLQYILYIYHFIPGFMMKATSYLAFTNKTKGQIRSCLQDCFKHLFSWIHVNISSYYWVYHTNISLTVEILCQVPV